MLQFIQDHSTLLTGLGVAVLDLVFALSPGLKSNGLLHSLFLLFGGKETP